MTNLSDFLKVKQVRCVNDDYEELTIGRTYELLGVSEVCVKAIGNDGAEHWFLMRTFEPVLDSAENALQGVELTPEFETEASEPKFEVGDKVYVGLTGKIAQVTEIIDDDVVNVANKNNEVRAWVSNICHATTENYERLKGAFPDIEFERPALTGSDLARAMLDKGWHLVPCVVSDVSDSDALNNDNCCLVDEWCVNYFESDGYRYEYAVPFDPRTGEPLTESILND